MFDNLSERLERSFKILKGEGKITEINVAETLKDVRRALLDADVNYKVAKNFTDTVKEKALGQNVLTAVKPSQLMVKIVHDELTTLMGGDTAEIELKGRPAVILMSGLQGSGKTTFSGKLARMMKSKKNRKPLLVACDVYRPAAITQLQVNGEKQGVEVFSMGDKQNPVDIAKASVEHAQKNGNNIVILDTAGRLHNKKNLMDELAKMRRIISRDYPDANVESLIVLDGTTGQNALEQARQFSSVTEINGIIITKLDGTAKGGIAIAIQSELNVPVKYIGIGEQIDDLQKFDPNSYVNALFADFDMRSDVEILVDENIENIPKDDDLFDMN